MPLVHTLVKEGILMKFVRFHVNHSEHIGIVENEEINEIQGNLFEQWTYTGDTYSIKEVKLLAPVQPNQVIGIGANYVGNKADLPNELPEIPVFFFKPVSSVIGTGEEIVIPRDIHEVKFESELAVVIGKTAKNIEENEALDYVFGYTIGNDVTAPQYFHRDGHWTIGKSFDSFTPLGPVIETELDPAVVRVEAKVNGVEKQNSPTEYMIIPLKKMIAYLSTVMTLHPGDVILTGSPLGAELIQENDTIECVIHEIGTLRNTLVQAK